MMPDPRNFPRFLPRPFAKLFVHFGEPIDSPQSALDRLLGDLRRRPSLNPRWWQDEEDASSHPNDLTHTSRAEAPTIPIPPMSAFPKPDPLPVPPSGWAPPPPGSLSALSLEATQRAQAQGRTADGQDPMTARSGLVELLRRELAWLGVKSRSLRREGALGAEKSEGGEELGRLVHRLMPEEDTPDKKR